MLMPNNILFIGHEYHCKTRSSAFFRSLLSELGTVEEIYDDSYLPTGRRRDYRAHVAKNGYALVVVWQIEYAALQLAGLPNVLFVPMFDSCRELPPEFWRRLDGMKVLAFSLDVYHRAQSGKCQARYVQYWPEAGVLAGPIRQPQRAYYWYRRNDISLSRLEWICRHLSITDLVIHYHPDPVVSQPISPDAFVERLSVDVRFTHWEEERNSLAEELAVAACYIASRPFEGIGMAFLEAMTAGCCVVAPRNPTYTDYIVSGETGLLYSQAYPATLSGDQLLRMGMAAAAAARAGRERWLAALPALRDWIVAGSGQGVLLPYPNAKGSDARHRTSAPLVSVITVVRNASRDLAETIASVAAQRGVALEYVVVDGASEDDTAEVASAHAAQIDTFVSRPDQGIYDAMNCSLELAKGEFVLFMNAGDTFVSADSLAEMMGAQVEDYDVIFGHHIYCRADGSEALHRANGFSETMDILQRGMLSDHWEHGMPCHQATATRRALLQKLGYDTRLRIAADRDFLFRAAAAGARFAVRESYVARYKAGGFSQRHAIDCVIEWQSMAQRHTGFTRNVREFYATRLLEAFERSAARSGSTVTTLRMAWRCRKELLSALALCDKRVVARHLWQKVKIDVAPQDHDRLPRTFHTTSRRLTQKIRLQGFSYPEDAGTWTERAEVEIVFPTLPRNCREVELHLAAVTRQLKQVPIAICADGEHLGHFVLKPGWNRVALPRPMELSILSINMPPALSPRDLGSGDDDRSLGIMLSRVVVR